MSTFKRKRTSNKTVFILRGIPGTGKTTLSNLIKETYECPECEVDILNRDMFRIKYISSNECKEICGKSLGYQESFSNPTINTIIRDKFYEELRNKIIELQLDTSTKDRILIVDSTNTKLADLIRTLDICGLKGNTIKGDYHVYIITKRKVHVNTHAVPDNVMESFKKELKESDEWLKKKYPYVNKTFNFI